MSGLVRLAIQVQTIPQDVPHGDECLAERQGDVFRCWDIHVPEGLAGQSVPLVVDLHGFLNNPSLQRAYSRLDRLADEERFIVAWPYGIHWSWNGGGDPWADEMKIDEVPGTGCCGHSLNRRTDDVKFIVDMVAELKRRYPIDARRVYLTGFSNGCFLAQRVVAEAPGAFTAMACTAGYSLTEPGEDYRPIPILEIQGTADSVVAYEPGYWPGAVANLRTWMKRNRCKGEPVEVWRESEHFMLQAQDCEGGAPVALLTIAGHDHELYKGAAWVTVDTTRMAWDFLTAATRSESP